VVAGAGLMALTGTGVHDVSGALLLLAVGLLATLAQMMMTQAYAVGHTLSNAGLQYLGIVFAFLYGVLLFGETLTWSALAGVVLIVGAGLSATLLSARLARPAPTQTPL
ncbi:MAG: EamA/RhaT family transporter, partial [Rubrivivax sp.]|nr:EamA/RhaT family transporter [Rubrivivax sp.]